MLDENGNEFWDAAFLVYQPQKQITDIKQHFELEKEKWLREYPLEHPEYELVFDRFIFAGEPILNSTGKYVLGGILFKAYLIKAEQP